VSQEEFGEARERNRQTVVNPWLAFKGTKLNDQIRIAS
jgi:hypothetical protein